jgi:hypothetical protein
VIGRSPSDAQPVFDTIVEQTVRLWEVAFGFVLRFDGKIISVAAHYNQSTACARASTRSSSLGGIMSPQHRSGNGRDLLTQLGV